MVGFEFNFETNKTVVILANFVEIQLKNILINDK